MNDGDKVELNSLGDGQPVQLSQDGAMWTLHAVPVTRRAAAFCIDCRRLIWSLVVPVNKEVQ